MCTGAEDRRIEVREYLTELTPEDAIDITHVFKRDNGPELVDFALNYRAKIEGKWYPVIRYDTLDSDSLHVHKFWRSPKQIPLEETLPRDRLCRKYMEDIVNNWERYRSNMERKVKTCS